METQVGRDVGLLIDGQLLFRCFLTVDQLAS